MFKMAILGAGAIAHKMSNTISQMDNVEPYIIADVNIEKAKEVGEKYGYTKICGSVDDILADDQVDLVYIALPHSLHYKFTKMCLELGVKGVECTPHLGASTPESETNCAVMAAAELSDYLKNGNIAHSVNLPDVSQPRVGGRRICIIHKNTPGAISAITGTLTAAHLNIENMVNKSKKDVAYTLLDVTGEITDTLAADLSGIEPAIRVRIL